MANSNFPSARLMRRIAWRSQACLLASEQICCILLQTAESLCFATEEFVSADAIVAFRWRPGDLLRCERALLLGICTSLLGSPWIQEDDEHTRLQVEHHHADVHAGLACC